MIHKSFYKAGLFGLGLVIATTPMALAGSRYAEKPPVILSPDLTEPWQLQLTSPRKARLVVRSSRSYTPASAHSEEARPRKARSEQPPAQRQAQKRSIANALALAAPSPRQTRPTETPPSPPRQSIAPQFLPQVVEYHTTHAPGTIVIDTNERYLYLVMQNGEAKRYGVGVGKPGFEWAGSHRVTRKAEWPSWRPPAEMIARERAKGRILPSFMEGGPANPLGARALYLGSTLYRIHGTNAPWTIGQAVSSGCIRMRNEDVEDLYPRVPVGAKVVVI